jgi:hypothetical protein
MADDDEDSDEEDLLSAEDLSAYLLQEDKHFYQE